ncbi:MAG: hypothetical protein ACRC11_19810 [Xenococcaceae cyanobacterium]
MYISIDGDLFSEWDGVDYRCQEKASIAFEIDREWVHIRLEDDRDRDLLPDGGKLTIALDDLRKLTKAIA